MMRYNHKSCNTKALNKWNEKKNNHYYKLYLPSGIIFVYNGNHSVNCGIIKHQGSLQLCNTNANLSIYDISENYSHIKFNGKKYIDSNSNKKYDTIFEYGCIYEIGRILLKYDINVLELI